jgi:hypothetical protein
MATYEIPVSQFPGGVAPSSYDEFVQRVQDDPGISATVVSPFIKPSDYGTIDPKVTLYTNVALSNPTETDIVDALAAASPGAAVTSVGSWLANFGTEAYFGAAEDLSAATSTTGGPSIRMDEAYTLAGGKFELDWSAIVGGTASGTEYTARFIFDRGNAEEKILTFNGVGDSDHSFSGTTRVIVPAGSYAIELEIERTSAPGSAEMRQTQFEYRWVGAS